jgi:hypothetical protein
MFLSYVLLIMRGCIVATVYPVLQIIRTCSNLPTNRNRSCDVGRSHEPCPLGMYSAHDSSWLWAMGRVITKFRKA